MQKRTFEGLGLLLAKMTQRYLEGEGELEPYKNRLYDYVRLLMYCDLSHLEEGRLEGLIRKVLGALIKAVQAEEGYAVPTLMTGSIIKHVLPERVHEMLQDTGMDCVMVGNRVLIAIDEACKAAVELDVEAIRDMGNQVVDDLIGAGINLAYLHKLRGDIEENQILVVDEAPTHPRDCKCAACMAQAKLEDVLTAARASLGIQIIQICQLAREAALRPDFDVDSPEAQFYRNALNTYLAPTLTCDIGADPVEVSDAICQAANDLADDGTWPSFWLTIVSKLTSLDHLREKAEELGWNLFETEDVLLVHRLDNLVAPEMLGEADLNRFLAQLKERKE